MDNILTVSALTRQIKQTLEEGFSSVSVVGEISGFKAHAASGHWYFNLKDSGAVICCTMWKGMNNYVFFTPQDGMKVILNGKITVYPPRGNYQVDVRSMRPAGVGELQAAFEILKQKLSDEGLFDPQYKKEIPVYSKKIGIAAAADSAAFRDLVSVAQRRFPLVELVVCSCRVQGTGAAESVASAIRQLNKVEDIDLIIVARGGGSVEDLWAFNEEIVARAIFKSRIPVITGIGHEIDFTIADFVSDLRAPTPSAAMEIATPAKEDFVSFIKEFSTNSENCLKDIIKKYRQDVKACLVSYGFRMPESLVKTKYQQLDSAVYKLTQNGSIYVNNKKNHLSLLSKSVEAHNIGRSLKKGFVLVRQGSKFVTRAESFNAENPAELKFYDGNVEINKDAGNKIID